MLLSFFSRRTLEADSRDSYGFSVRPQHIQAYKEYSKIYKEEEEQRSEKWSSFLEQCSESQPSKPAEVKSEASLEAANTVKMAVTLENPGEGDDTTSKKFILDRCKESVSRKMVPVVQGKRLRRIIAWEPIKLSLSPIEKIMRTRVKKKPYMVNDHDHSVQKNQQVDAEIFARNDSHKTAQEQSTDKNVTSKDNCNAAEAIGDSSENEHICHDSHKKIDLSIVEDPDAKRSADSSPNAVNKFEDAELKISANSRPNDVDESVTHEPFFPWEELESLVQVGVPKALRGEIWQAFVGVQTRRVEKYYQKLISPGLDTHDNKNMSGASINGPAPCVPEKWRKQIEKDLPRTFPGHPALDEEGRSSLRRILTAYALHNPSVGYCQAMNFFAGLLLLLMPEENAFWTLVGLIDDYFDGYFSQDMIESQVDQLVFDELMRERFPKLVKHLDFLGVEVAWVSGSWFLSIFVNMLPWESVLRVWDVLLFEGNRVMLFRTALAIMELYGPALVTTKDAGDAVTLLQNLSGSTFDSSQLVFTACIGFLDVAESKLEELRSKHRPSVLAIIEERKKEKKLSKVESKLYSFKHRKSLVKEPKRKESLGGKRNHSIRSITKSAPDNFDEFMCTLSIDSESDSVPGLQEQVVRFKAELSHMMDERRLSILRVEELEMALRESKRDDRQKLMGRIEQLEQEVALLRQILADKQEQERATLQVLMRVEQEKKEAENARIAGAEEVAAQKHEAYLQQQGYENAMASLAEMEKSLLLAAEPMLEDALQKESDGAEAVSSPRLDNSPHG